MLLVAALLFPALLLVAALMLRAYKNERAILSEKLLTNARAVGGIVDRELRESEAILRAIASSRDLAMDELPAVAEMARGAVNKGRWFALTNPDRVQLINTLVSLGDPLPPVPDNPEMEAAMQTNQSYVSNLITGPVAQNLVLHVSLPVFRHGRLKYMLHLVSKPADFAAALDVATLASSGLVSVVDRNGRIVARSRASEEFVGKTASPPMIDLLNSAEEGVRDTVTLDGVPVITAFHRTKFGHWGAVVATPRATLAASAQRLLWVGIGLSALLIVVAAVFAWWITLGLTRAVDELVTNSKAVGTGHPFLFQPQGLVETDLVGEAMARSAMQLKQTNDRLQRAIDRLNFSLSSLELGDWSWDAETDDVKLSPRAAAIYDLETGCESLPRSRLRERIHPDDRPKAKLSAAAAFKSGSDYRSEYRVMLRGGETRWVAVAGRTVGGDGQGRRAIFGVVQDITSLKHAEQVLREEKEVLEQKVAERTHRLSETIGELEAFSYSISHDMRAPLRAMRNYARLLRTEQTGEFTEEGAHYLSRIEANAARLELLVRDVLAYSRVSKEAVEMTSIDLDRFLRELLAQWSDTLGKQAVIQVPEPLPTVLAHEAYLWQIFTNLIGNGVKFVAAGTAPRVVITAERASGRVKISVRDNGIGIAKSDLGRIFRIFGRLHPETAFEGTGIGLAIVKKAVQRMGGELGVDSSVGEGSTFWFTLTTP